MGSVWLWVNPQSLKLSFSWNYFFLIRTWFLTITTACDLTKPFFLQRGIIWKITVVAVYNKCDDSWLVVAVLFHNFNFCTLQKNLCWWIELGNDIKWVGIFFILKDVALFLFFLFVTNTNSHFMNVILYSAHMIAIRFSLVKSSDQKIF